MTAPPAASIPEWSDRALRRAIGAGDVVFWLGAGISMWEPSRLPSGIALRDRLLADVFRGSPLLHSFARRATSRASRFRRAIAPIAPEPVGSSLEHGMGVKFLDGWIDLFAAAAPNALHDAIARAANSTPLHVVTTNFDLCLEKAGLRARVVRTPNELPHRMTSPLLLKVHGCASEPRSMYPFITRFNSFIEPRMRRALERIVDGRVIVFAGYSASDFDLLPILQSLRPRAVVFVIRSDADLDASAQQRALLGQHGGHKIVGMDAFFRALSGVGSLDFPRRGDEPPPVVADEHEHLTAAAHLLRAVNFCDDDVELCERVRRRSAAAWPRDQRRKLLDSLSFSYREINDYDRSEQVLDQMRAERLISAAAHRHTRISIAILRHDFDLAERLLRRAERFARAAAERVSIEVARVRVHMHRVALGEEHLDVPRVRRVLGDQLRAAEQSGDIDAILSSWRFGARCVRLQVATSGVRDDAALAEARRELERALFWWRAVGRRQGTINTLRELGMLEATSGELDRAYATFSDALREQETTRSSRYDRIKILWWLRRLAAMRGDDTAARRHGRALERFLHAQPARLRRQWSALLRDLDRSAGFVG